MPANYVGVRVVKLVHLDGRRLYAINMEPDKALRALEARPAVCTTAGCTTGGKAEVVVCLPGGYMGACPQHAAVLATRIDLLMSSAPLEG